MTLLIGTGRMGLEYAKVLKALDEPFIVVGRGEKSASDFHAVTGIPVIAGGISSFVESTENLPGTAIIAVNVTSLDDTCRLLIEKGVKNILLEKPGALNVNQIQTLNLLAEKAGAGVYIAYNRRFHASVAEGRRLLEADGGVTSFRFEFTEWSDKIEPFEADPEEKQRWFLSNSSHVADLAFYLGGEPETVDCLTAGSLSWHDSSSLFSGAGRTPGGALFSYSANWDAPGRWGVEVMSRNLRIILQPLEQLYIQKRGSVAIEKVEIDDSADKNFKPGLLRMVESFLRGDTSSLCSISGQASIFPVYCRIAGYSSE